MKGTLRVLKSTLSAFNGLVAEGVTLRHLEADKLLFRGKDLEFSLWHRNIIFEEKHLRLNGFVLYNGIMGQLECIITFQDG